MSELHETYQRDFLAWALRNAELLRQGRLAEVDAEHLAEELETMGRKERHELVSRLKILVGHLLKWQLQAAHRSSSWRGSIAEQRLRVADLVDFSPSLKPYFDAAIAAAYPDAVKLAARETGLRADRFPPTCPFGMAAILDQDFLPERDEA
jgi:hypothetical protein